MNSPIAQSDASASSLEALGAAFRFRFKACSQAGHNIVVDKPCQVVALAGLFEFLDVAIPVLRGERRQDRFAAALDLSPDRQRLS